MTEAIANLELVEDYRSKRTHLFPSAQSLEWFVRKNRDELVKAGALLLPTGRWMVRPEAFDQVVVRVGERRAVSH